VIEAGAHSLSIRKGSAEIVHLDEATRDYVRTSIVGRDIVSKVVGVGALNVNSGNGRVFLEDIGKTVPFSVVKEPEPGTYAVLAASLDRYARGLPSRIIIRCREVLTVDRRIKKVIIMGAVEAS
jgi:hypothetical protein